MTTELTDKKIKPKKQDDDSFKKVFSRLSISKWIEWSTETSDEVTFSFEKQSYTK